MAGQIRMTPEQMRQRAGEFRVEGDNTELVIDKMQRLIDTLRSEWEGVAAQRFDEQFQELKPSFQKMRELITDISTQLDQTANAVEQLDQDIASKFGV
jgi:WXG100 family type VII secretion target